MYGSNLFMVLVAMSLFGMIHSHYWSLANSHDNKWFIRKYQREHRQSKQHFHGHGYQFSDITGSSYKFHSEPAVWFDALMECYRENAKLAIINSAEESKVLREIFSEYPEFGVAFIGFHDQFSEGNYVTIESEPLEDTGFIKFSPTQPDNAFGGENCGSIHKDGLMNDYGCHRKTPFICERRAEVPAPIEAV